MNNMVCEGIKKTNNRLTSVLFRRTNRLPLWLVIICAFALPEYVHATAWDSIASGGCADQNGISNGTMTLQLPPSVSFDPDNLPSVGKILYTSPTPYTISYKCKPPAGAPYPFQTALVSQGHFSSLRDALSKAGLKLNILISDSSDGPPIIWSPTGVGGKSFGPSYTSEISRTVYLRAQLMVEKPASTGFYVTPPLTSFKLIADNGWGGPGIFLATSAVRIQYVPTCFVQTGLGTHNINFGPVLTTDVDNSFSRTLPFTVTASVNKVCDHDVLHQGYDVSIPDKPKQTFYLRLPLKVSFILNEGGELSSDNKSILLHNENDERNGLQLKIASVDGRDMSFNDPKSAPVNQFGDFHGGVDNGGQWNVAQTYNATLSGSLTGDSVKTGKYSARVTVKVDYY